MKIQKRPLLSIDFLKENNDDLILWCDDYATFINQSEYEFMFWIPPFDGKDTYLETAYGHEIPEKIKKVLNKAINMQSDKNDHGFLLISFV